MATLTPNSKIIFNFVKENDGNDITFLDIAEATGLTGKQVTGSLNAFCKKQLMERVPVSVEAPEGGTKTVKYIVLTDLGRQFVIED